MSRAGVPGLDPGDSRLRDGVAWREYAVVLAAAVLSLYLTHFRRGIFIYTLSQQEGGVWIDEALRTLQGDVIYRDFFDFLMPGTIYVNAAFLALLGPHTASLGIIVILWGALGTLAVHRLSAAILPSPWRYIPAPVFLILTYPAYSPGNHKWPTVLFCLAGLLAVVRQRTRLRCAAAGIALGAATLSTQDFGVGAAAGLGTALWLLHRRQEAADPWAFLVAYGLTVGITLVGFSIAAGLPNIWYAVVTFPLTQYPNAEHHFTIGLGGPQFMPLWLTAFGLGGAGLFYAAAGMIRSFWRTDPAPVVIVALTGAGLLVIGGVAHPIEPTLFGVRAVPLTIVGLFAIRRVVAARGMEAWASRALAGLGVLLAIYAVGRPFKRQFSQTLYREVHRAGPIWVVRPMDDLTWLEANTVEGQRVFLFPDKGGLYFLSRTRNPTSYGLILDQGVTAAAQVLHAAQQVTATCPAVGIWDRTRLASFARNRPDWYTAEPLYLAIRRDYDIVAELPNGAFGLRRTTDCGTVGRESR